LTRAARLALTGDLEGATHLHPLWFVVLPYVGVVALAESRAYVRDGAWGAVLGTPRVKNLGAAILVALLVVWIARWMGAFGGPVDVS